MDSEEEIVTSNQNQKQEIQQVGKKAKEKTSFSEAIQKILTKKIKKGYEANPIFSEFKKPFKKIKKELDEKKKIQQKKIELQEFISKFHIKPNYQADRTFENSLKRIAIKGVVKLYNQIKEAQSKKQEEQ